MLEEQRFAIATALIKVRSTLVLDQIFPKMSDAHVPVGQSLPEPEVEKILGIELTHKLKQITAGIFTNVDEDLVSLKVQHDLLREAMKSLYPKRKVLQVFFHEPLR